LNELHQRHVSLGPPQRLSCQFSNRLTGCG
jgi:hypothetical protein